MATDYLLKQWWDDVHGSAMLPKVGLGTIWDACVVEPLGMGGLTLEAAARILLEQMSASTAITAPGSE